MSGQISHAKTGGMEAACFSSILLGDVTTGLDDVVLLTDWSINQQTNLFCLISDFS